MEDEEEHLSVLEIADETDLLNYVTTDLELPLQPLVNHRIRLVNEFDFILDVDDLALDDQLHLQNGGDQVPVQNENPHRPHRHRHHARRYHRRLPIHRIHSNLNTPLVKNPRWTLFLVTFRNLLWRICLLLSGLCLLPVAFALVSVYFPIAVCVLFLIDVCRTTSQPVVIDDEEFEEEEEEELEIKPEISCAKSCQFAITQYRIHFFSVICIPISFLTLGTSVDIDQSSPFPRPISSTPPTTENTIII